MHLHFSLTRSLPLFLLCMTFLASCTSDKVKNIPDVSSIEVNLNIQRFEKDLFNKDTVNVAETMLELEKEYPDFFKPVFLGKIIPPLQDPEVFSLFVRSPQIHHLYDTCMLVFTDFEEIEAELNQAFRFYKHYFPQRTVPKVITYISEYTLGNFTLEEDMLGIGLDFFLGENYPLYNPRFFPKYIRRSMTKDHVVAKSMYTLVKNLTGETEGNRLIDMMVHNGKTLYILDQLLPYAPDSIKLEYTAAQTSWCEDNEMQIWAHLLKEELLYSTQMKDIRKLVDHSPNSPGMPEDAPGRTANWLGWQIIKSYMQRYPDTTLDQLIELEDAQQLLEKSKYKPKR